METPEQISKKKKILVGTIIALALILSFAFYFGYTANRDKADLIAQKSELNIAFTNLSDTLEANRQQIELLGNKNTDLDNIIAQNQLTIEGKKKEIAVLLSKEKMTKSEFANAKKMVAEYQKSIAELQKQLIELTEQNQVLTQQNQQLMSDLELEKLSTTQLKEMNVVLAKKVEVGSLLQLSNIKVEGVREKNNGKDKVVSRLSVAESIRVSFEAAPNKVLEKGQVSLYVRIINPRGETISIANQGSGILQLTDSEPVQYSTKADIDWMQTNRLVEVYWKQMINTPGIYKAEIYQSGYLLGKGEVNLK